MNFSAQDFKGCDLVVFDFDGTIANLNIDWDGLKRELSNFCRKKYKMEIVFQPLNETIQKIKDILGKNFEQECNKIIAKYEPENIEKLVSNNEILKVINVYASGKRKAVFSNNLCQTIKKGLEILKLENEFQAICGRDSVEKYKPDPEGLFKIIDICGVDPEKTIFIGNSKSDELAGRFAKIKTIIIQP